MDLSTVIGIFVGLVLIIIAVGVRGGVIDFSTLVRNILGFWNIPSVMITFGGAFSAILINYPLKQVIGVFKIAKKVFTESEENPMELISTFVNYAQKARREGLLSLEGELIKINNNFLKRGMYLLVDGADQNFIRTMLETELAFVQERHKIGQEIFYALGTYCPAFGMIGTIIGLILMLANLEDQSQIASGMAVALLTTFYGATAAYLIFLPICGKLKRRSEAEVFIKEVISRGILLLQSGASPTIVETNLKAYLEPKYRKKAEEQKKKTKEKAAVKPTPSSVNEAKK